MKNKRYTVSITHQVEACNETEALDIARSSDPTRASYEVGPTPWEWYLHQTRKERVTNHPMIKHMNKNVLYYVLLPMLVALCVCVVDIQWMGHPYGSVLQWVASGIYFIYIMGLIILIV